MNLTKEEIWDIQHILKRERDLMMQKSQEWYNDNEDDKSISLMCDNKANMIDALINKLDEILKYEYLTKSIVSFNESVKSDENINEDFKNLFI